MLLKETLKIKKAQWQEYRACLNQANCLEDELLDARLGLLNFSETEGCVRQQYRMVEPTFDFDICAWISYPECPEINNCKSMGCKYYPKYTIYNVIKTKYEDACKALSKAKKAFFSKIRQ